jgi:hypothetical protein
MHLWIKVILSVSLALPVTVWAWKILPEYLQRGD